jgi:hypothetical protein
MKSNVGYPCYYPDKANPPPYEPLSQDIGQYASVNVGKAAIDAIVVESQATVIEAQYMQYRRMQIVNGRYVIDSFVTKFVCSAVAESLFNAGSR